MAGSSPPLPSAHPQERKKVGREAERTAMPISSPRLRGRGRGHGGQAKGADQSQATGPGLGGAARPGAPRSPPPLARAPRPAQARPGCGRLRQRRGSGGGGAGVPRRRILPGAGGWERRGGGGGRDSGNGGLGRTRARHERGPREASWVESGRAAPGERGEEPGSEVRALENRSQSPPRERSEREEPFCFPPRRPGSPAGRAAFPRGRWRERAPLADLLTPPPPPPTHTAQLAPSPQLPSQPPVLGLQ